MSTIHLKQQQIDEICEHGESVYPSECCGALIGTVEDDVKTVVELYPVGNARDSSNRHNRYLIPPDELMILEKHARKSDLSVIGFYHSHPDVEAKPSEFDRNHAWPWYSYIIVSVMERVAKNLTSWILSDDRVEFNEENMVFK